MGQAYLYTTRRREVLNNYQRSGPGGPDRTATVERHLAQNDPRWRPAPSRCSGVLSPRSRTTAARIPRRVQPGQRG